MTGELIATGVTFGTGRRAINDAFSGTAELNHVILDSGANFSAGTGGGIMFSGGTDLYDIFATSASGSTDTYTTAATISNETILFDTNQQLNAYSVSLSSITGNFISLTGTSDQNISGSLIFDDDVSLAFNSGSDSFYFDSTGGDLNIEATDQLIINTTNGTNFTGGPILSGGTDLYDIFSTTDFFTTAATISNETIFFDTNQQLSAYSVSLSSITGGFISLTGTSDQNISGSLIFDDDVSLAFNSGSDSFYFDSTGGDLNIEATDQLIINTTNGVDFTGGPILSGGTDLYDIFCSLPCIGGSGSTTASNGLTKTGDNITLGGFITANTTIDLVGNELTLSSGVTTMLKGTSSATVSVSSIIASYVENNLGNTLPGSAVGASYHLGWLEDVAAGDSTTQIVGASSIAAWAQSTPGVTLSKNSGLVGLQARAMVTSAGTVTWAAGIISKVRVSNVLGEVTNAVGMRTEIEDGGLGTVGNFRGIFIPDMSSHSSVPDASLRYGIYQDDPGNNYLAGDLQVIGNLSGNTILSGGTDLNLIFEPIGGGGGGLSTADNGLTVVGSKVSLGGTLTGDTTINTGTNNWFVDAGVSGKFIMSGTSSGLEQIKLLNDSGLGPAFLSVVKGNSSINGENSAGTVFSQVQAGAGAAPSVILRVVDAATDTKRIDISETAFTVYDEIESKGMEYFSDYSANYSERSLVDKGFVAAHASSAVTANAFLDLGVQAGTVSWAALTDPNAFITFSGNCTLDVTSFTSGLYGTLKITQDGTGSRTLTLGTGTHKVANGGGGAITLTSTPGSIDIITFAYDGTEFLWTIGPNYT